jgi:NitT/TauT family transport system permease protein
MAGSLTVRRSLASPVVIRWLGVIALLFAGEAAARAGLINRHIVPLPSQVLEAFYRVLSEERVFAAVGLTIVEVLAAGLLVLLVGVSLGILLARNETLRRAWANWVAGLAAAPVVLLYPLFLVIFGRTPTTIVMIGFVAGLPPVVLKTLEAISGTRQVFLDVGRSFNLTAHQQFWKIILPSALSGIFLGLRLGLIYAMITMVAVEYLINIGGLGKLVNELAERYDLPGTYAVICLVIGVSIMFFILLEKCERWLRPST